MLPSAESLLITMNRDEQRARAAERAPSLRSWGAGMAVYPLDTHAGGTWIAAIAAAGRSPVCLALLNGYSPRDRQTSDATGPSRGMIIPELSHIGDLTALSTHLRERFDPAPYRSFRLICVDVRNLVYAEWDPNQSTEWSVRMHPSPLQTRRPWLATSSSWRQDEVARQRGLWFAQWLAGGCSLYGTLPTFHLYCPDDYAATAPLVAREHVATRSITQVDLSSEGAQMRYLAEPFAHRISTRWPSQASTCQPTQLEMVACHVPRHAVDPGGCEPRRRPQSQ